MPRSPRPTPRPSRALSPSDPRARAYRLAAIAYVLYGLLYLGGAVLALTPERMGLYFGFLPWWALDLVGAALLAVLPLLVLRQWTWLTRILALGPAAKALVLFRREGMAMAGGESPSLFTWAFALTAVLAALTLSWAGWGHPRAASPEEHPPSHDGHGTAHGS